MLDESETIEAIERRKLKQPSSRGSEQPSYRKHRSGTWTSRRIYVQDISKPSLFVIRIRLSLLFLKSIPAVLCRTNRWGTHSTFFHIMSFSWGTREREKEKKNKQDHWLAKKEYVQGSWAWEFFSVIHHFNFSISGWLYEREQIWRSNTCLLKCNWKTGYVG